MDIIALPSDDGNGGLPATVATGAVPVDAEAPPPPIAPGSLADSYAEFVRFMGAFCRNVNGDASKLVAELRVPNVPAKYGKPRTECGFFDLLNADGKKGICAAVKDYLVRTPDLQPPGVYLTLNPVDPVFLARANNRMGRTADKISAEDKHILYRRWLVVDCDPKRPIAGISATDAEKAAARLVIDGVRDDLRIRGWSAPILCDSGNGFHLWYRIDLPADDGGLVQRILKGLAARHDTAFATVDTTVFNASRIMKIPGTWARKGDSTPDRTAWHACWRCPPHETRTTGSTRIARVGVRGTPSTPSGFLPAARAACRPRRGQSGCPRPCVPHQGGTGRQRRVRAQPDLPRRPTDLERLCDRRGRRLATPVRVQRGLPTAVGGGIRTAPEVERGGQTRAGPRRPWV